MGAGTGAGAGGGAWGLSTVYMRASSIVIRGASGDRISGPSLAGGYGMGTRYVATDTAMDFPAFSARDSLFQAAL